MPLLFQKIQNYLKEPFPHKHKKWQIVIIPSFCVFVMMSIFKPNSLPTDQRSLEIILYITLSTIVVTAVVAYIFPLIFKKYYNPKNWTKGKFLSVPISIVTILMPLLMIVINNWFHLKGISSQYTPVVQLIVLYLIGYSIAFFPTFIIYHIAIRSDQRENRKKNNPVFNKCGIIITSKLKETLELAPTDFLYAEVQGNYVTIYYLTEQQDIQHKTLRVTLSVIIDTLRDYPSIMRCHRAFLINTLYIKEIFRKQQNYGIRLNNTTIEIPVSKPYLKEIQSAIM